MWRLQGLRQALRAPQARAPLSTVAAAPTPMATELLKYAFGSLKSGVTDDVLRTVEHGSQMLQAPSDAGPVKLLLARLHVERGRHDAAVDVLHSLMDPAQGHHPRVRMTANETLCMLCLREGEDGNAATVATAAVREAQGGGPGGNSEHELPVRAYTLAALVHCVTAEGGGDGLTAADTVSQMAGTAMQQWDAAAGGATPSAAQDATVATSLATAAAMLHSTLPVRDADTFKMLGWAYTRAATAGVTATEAAGEDPVGAAAALHVEEEALLGYSQVLLQRGQYKEAEMQLTEAMRLIETAADGPARAHRLGLALSVLASVYAQRSAAERRSLESQLGEPVTEQSGGSFVLAEGLFRRAADLLGAPLVLSGGAQVVQHKGPAMLPVDAKVTALLRGRYAAVLEFMPGRSAEAARWRRTAEEEWAAAAAEAVPLAVMLGDAPPPSLVHLRTGRLLIPMVPPADDCDTKLP